MDRQGEQDGHEDGETLLRKTEEIADSEISPSEQRAAGVFLSDLWIPVYTSARVTSRLFCLHVCISRDPVLAAMLFVINSGSVSSFPKKNRGK